MTCYGPQTTYPRITCTQGRGGRFFFQFLTSVAPLPKSFSIKEAFFLKKMYVIWEAKHVFAYSDHITVFAKTAKSETYVNLAKTITMFSKERTNFTLVNGTTT